MEKDKMPPKELRRRAELLLTQSKAAPGALDANEVAHVVQELQIHQIELELQQQELLGANRSLDEARSSLLDLFQNAPVGYAVLNDKGVVLKINETLRELLQLPAKTRHIPYNFTDFLAEEERHVFLSRYHAVFTHPEGKSMTVLFKRGDNEKRHVQLDFRHTASGGWHGGEVFQTQLMVSATDISERVRLEQVLKREKEQAEEANRAKSEFLSQMSHELRTPMNAVLGFAQILLMPQSQASLSSKQLEYVQQIHKSGETLLTMIGELLDLSRVESGRMPIALSDVAVRDILDECRWLFSDMAQEKGLYFVVDQSVTGNLYARADPLRLKQVLSNLIGNALKYCHKGDSVMLECQALEQGVRFSVRDTGPGIPEEVMSHIFEPFYRQKEHEHIQGTGVGLALSAKLMHLMQGRIELKSKVGEGCLFQLELPLAGTPAQNFTAEESAVWKAQGGDVPPLRETLKILCVDDDPMNNEVLDATLQHLGNMTVYLTQEPRQVHEMVRNYRPDLVFLDIRMAGMDGYTVLKQLRDDPATQKTPVVAISAQAMRSNIEKALQAGFDAYVAKPFSIDDIKIVLDKASDGNLHQAGT